MAQFFNHMMLSYATLDPPDLATTTSAPLVGIVIPLYRHSVLVTEAIDSAVHQITDFTYKVVIVIDGCPNTESHSTTFHYLRAYPDRIIRVQKPNEGLSSARNAGVRCLLRAWPSIQAVYFLDADNRLLPYALQNAWDTLSQARTKDDTVAWAYPDIDMFLSDYNADHRGSFSRLRLLYQNYCEAGSLAHRCLFDAGLRFDEQMKYGFEDWEFWWQAIEKGYKGAHVENMGFQYRKRPESMLKDAGRVADVTLGYMRQKHPTLLSPKTLLRFEH